MKKKTIVGCVILLAAAFIVMISIFYISYNRQKSDGAGNKSKTDTNIETGYYIKDTDGYVTAYLSDEKTIFETTTITVNSLPLEIQKLLKQGIKVETIGEVYGFLENYSS